MIAKNRLNTGMGLRTLSWPSPLIRVEKSEKHARHTKEELLELELRRRVKFISNRMLGKKPYRLYQRKQRKRQELFRDHWEASWLHQDLDRCRNLSLMGTILNSLYSNEPTMNGIGL